MADSPSEVLAIIGGRPISGLTYFRGLLKVKLLVFVLAFGFLINFSCNVGVS